MYNTQKKKNNIQICKSVCLQSSKTLILTIKMIYIDSNSFWGNNTKNKQSFLYISLVKIQESFKYKKENIN